MAETDKAGYEREYPRETVRTKAEIMIDRQWHDCLITNISKAGARLYKKLNVSRGMDVLIRIGEAGQFNAKVAWCMGDEFGMKFDHNPIVMTRVMAGMGL